MNYEQKSRIKLPDVQVSDTRDDDESATAGFIIKANKRPVEIYRTGEQREQTKNYKLQTIN